MPGFSRSHAPAWERIRVVIDRKVCIPTEDRGNEGKFVGKGVSEGRKPGLTAGGLVRSVGGWQELNALRREKVHFKSDERILGDSDFVETVLDFASEEMERKYRLKADGYTFEEVGKRVAELFDMSHSDVTTPGKQPRRVQARSVLSFWAVHELGMSATAVGLEAGA